MTKQEMVDQLIAALNVMEQIQIAGRANIEHMYGAMLVVNKIAMELRNQAQAEAKEQEQKEAEG